MSCGNFRECWLIHANSRHLDSTPDDVSKGNTRGQEDARWISASLYEHSTHPKVRTDVVVCLQSQSSRDRDGGLQRKLAGSSIRKRPWLSKWSDTWSKDNSDHRWGMMEEDIWCQPLGTGQEKDFFHHYLDHKELQQPLQWLHKNPFIKWKARGTYMLNSFAHYP